MKGLDDDRSVKISNDWSRAEILYSTGHTRDVDGNSGAIGSKHLIISNIVSWFMEFFVFLFFFPKKK